MMAGGLMVSALDLDDFFRAVIVAYRLDCR